ncbi:hypothetical protein L873DRAFT_228859 [Choiromyces venosus 120613-1]|uniref:Uncharacterized protein n=1 Tax=Choiromyces venosus 120613-1 TaxID=1336337 RepID=A0A3N4JYI4_9PEZI|nr:hypothetical protein L873DRAFT_1420171 [Choiromyces venosus 120613-1]RPB03297.1 hypothetical protein L873DRAFT_228859 [Choiromyces venosus 120613-1]
MGLKYNSIMVGPPNNGRKGEEKRKLGLGHRATTCSAVWFAHRSLLVEVYQGVLELCGTVLGVYPSLLLGRKYYCMYRRIVIIALKLSWFVYDIAERILLTSPAVLCGVKAQSSFNKQTH